MANERPRQALPDLPARYCQHLSFCFAGDLDADLLEGLSGKRVTTSGTERARIVSEYSRQGCAHYALLEAEPFGEPSPRALHIILQCEPRPWPSEASALVNVHGRTSPSKRRRVGVRQFEDLLATLRFDDDEDAAVHLTAIFEYPAKEYEAHPELPLGTGEGIEIAGIRFRTDAPPGSVIVDLGPEGSHAVHVTLYASPQLPLGEALVEAALDVACRDTAPFVTAREEDAGQ